MPPGCPSDFYSQIIAASCDEWSKVVLDTAAGFSSILKTCEGIQCEVLLKVNARELCGIASVDISDILSQSESVVSVPSGTLGIAARKVFETSSALKYIAGFIFYSPLLHIL